MKFFIMLITGFLLILGLYYITVIIHIISPIFGRMVSPLKACIPFYGWRVWIKNPYIG